MFRVFVFLIVAIILFLLAISSISLMKRQRMPIKTGPRMSFVIDTIIIPELRICY
jgi:hypothetical protein